MNRNNWNTYATTGYTHDVANDQRSAGGVHLHQVRVTRAGHYQRRVLQSNGRYKAAGPAAPIDQAEGEALLAQAEKY